METISWKTHEFEKKDRHPDWIWAAGGIALVVAIFAFFYGNIFFGIFSIIAGAAVIFFALRDPKEVTITLSKEGVAIDAARIPYADIEKFWLDEGSKTTKLLLAVKKGFLPILVIPLDGVTTESVREFLKQHAVESEFPLSLSTQIFDRLGF